MTRADVNEKSAETTSTDGPDNPTAASRPASAPRLPVVHVDWTRIGWSRRFTSGVFPWKLRGQLAVGDLVWAYDGDVAPHLCRIEEFLAEGTSAVYQVVEPEAPSLETESSAGSQAPAMATTRNEPMTNWTHPREFALWAAALEAIDPEIMYHAETAVRLGYDTDEARPYLAVARELWALRDNLGPHNADALDACLVLLRAARLRRAAELGPLTGDGWPA
jgi:hypothetical protein